VVRNRFRAGRKNRMRISRRAALAGIASAPSLISGRVRAQDSLPPTLAAFLDRIYWDARERGPLLVVAPEKAVAWGAVTGRGAPCKRGHSPGPRPAGRERLPVLRDLTLLRPQSGACRGDVRGRAGTYGHPPIRRPPRTGARRGAEQRWAHRATPGGVGGETVGARPWRYRYRA
jgi:hypothetical protein